MNHNDFEFMDNFATNHYEHFLQSQKAEKSSKPERKKLRLLLFEECNRNCAGCCNHDWDLKSLPVCTDYRPYDLIMLTGGEPMLHPDIVREAIERIRQQTAVPIYLYTAMVEGLDDLLPMLDGVTLTLHSPKDVAPFYHFDMTAKNVHGKKLRLNIFEEVGSLSCHTWWKVKDRITWIKDCPLPEGEVLMRYKAPTEG